VTAIHGITTELAQEYGIAQSDAQYLFLSLIQRCDVLVAHNIDFDMEMVQLNWLGAWTIAQNKQQFCTMRELTPIMKLPKNGKNHYHDNKYPDFKAPRLQEAYTYFFHKEFTNAHDAMADVRACRDVYFAMQPLIMKDTENA
jgi:DNA polymerase-3 subunit epsilon